MANALVVVTRQQWGAVPPKGGIATLRYPVEDVFQHHEAGAVFTSLSMADEVARMRALQLDMMRRGYSDFAYGVAVFPSGRVYEGRDLGFIGGGHDDEEAATGDHNANSIAILWPGNFETQTVTPAQADGTADIIALAVACGRVLPHFVYQPHSAATGDSTDCPGVHGRAGMLPVMEAYNARYHVAKAPVITPAGAHHPTVYVLIRNQVAVVTELQRKLHGACGQGIAVDGSFGLGTRAAVMNVQRFCGLSVDGICGPQTWEAVDFAARTHKPPVT